LIIAGDEVEVSMGTFLVAAANMRITATIAIQNPNVKYVTKFIEIGP